jgi:Outer membrane protein beta-barrel family/Carboxypeptidase regulatory-like domain
MQIRCLIAVIFFSIVLSAMGLSVFAQHDGSVRGRLEDTISHSPISDATVTVLDIRDSSLVDFTRSKSSGYFQVSGLKRGKYRLLVTHIGYRPVSRFFFISELVEDPDLGIIAPDNKASLLDAVTVEQEAAPVSIRHDTIEFNAGSFKTKPDAVVEDLLKKLPGVQVDKNGVIKANGEEVKKVLVDGKEFFGSDPKIASKNLPADAVDKVQVFDKKSDQSQFTGFDDGNSQKTINLTIKKDKKHGIFGKVAGGTGMDLPKGNDRFEDKFNINQFRDGRQLSVLGMVNNTNKQGFSFQDVLGFNGGMAGPGSSRGIGMGSNPFNSGIPIQGLTDNNQAITTTTAGGLNFNDEWPHHTEVSGSYFYNGTDDAINLKDARQYLAPDNSYTQDQASSGRRHDENHRFTFIADHRIDSLNSMKFTSSLISQSSYSLSNVIDTSRGLVGGALLNEGFSNTAADATGYEENANVLFRHRFEKRGRTLSANFSLGLNGTTGGGKLYSVNRYYQGVSMISTDSLNQVYELPGTGSSYGASLVYTEPLSKKTLLEFNASFYQSHSNSDKRSFDADSAGKFTLPDAPLTTDFKNTYTYEREGIQLRNQQRKINFAVGANLQQAISRNHFGYMAGDSSFRQSFLNVLPNANLEYDFNRYRNLRLYYNTHTTPPGVQQLQPVPDNSDPLNIRLGNPRLRQEYYHSLRLSYLSFDPFRRTSFFAAVNYNGIHDRIVNEAELASTGVQVSMPVNLGGLFRMNGNLSWEFPLRLLKSNLNLNSSALYDHSAGLVNSVRNNSNNWTLSQGADLNFLSGESLDITVGVKADYNDVRYSLQPGQNQVYWTEDYTVDFNWYLRNRFSIASDLDYTHRSGLPAGYNSSPFIWNAGLAEKLFNNKKGTIRLQVFDMLSQNTGFSRSTSQNYIEDISYRVLNRYWLLSFSYNISRFAGKGVQGNMEPGKVDLKIIK